MHCNRRHFLNRVLGFSVLSGLSWGSPLFAYPWKTIFPLNRRNGEARVLFVEGKVQEDGREVFAQSTLKQTAKLALGYTGRILLLFPDGSLLFSRGKSRLDLEIGQITGTFVRLYQGAIQIITNQLATEFYPFLVSTNFNNFGMKDATAYIEVPLDEPWNEEQVQKEWQTYYPDVFLQNTENTEGEDLLKEKGKEPSSDSTQDKQAIEKNFSEEDPTKDTDQKKPAKEQRDSGKFKMDIRQIPQFQPLTKDYLCVCHGTVDCMDANWNRNLKSLFGNQHNSNFFSSAQEFIKAPRKNHSNLMLRQMASYFQGGYSDFSWLPPNLPPNVEEVRSETIWPGEIWLGKD